MACERALTAYRPVLGDGPIHFKPPADGRAYTKIELPCGTCILCRNEQARQWAVRIHHEAQLTPSNSFLTLTYDDAHLPEFGSLSSEDDQCTWQRPEDRKHLSKFWKRLRDFRKRRNIRGKLRYYVAGEYGDESLRPHYHACVFGEDFYTNARIIARKPNMLWANDELTELWGYGNVVVGQLNFATARYTASYVLKKLRAKQRYVRVDEQTGELLELVQPRAYMSKNIGKDWWNRYRHYVTANDFVIIDGQRQRAPKAHDRWLKERSEIAEQMLKSNRQLHAVKLSEEQTRARARNAHARAEMKSKKL